MYQDEPVHDMTPEEYDALFNDWLEYISSSEGIADEVEAKASAAG